MSRIEHLNTHLTNLQNLTQFADYGTEIANTIVEIEKELGINDNKGLSSYSTKELHEELSEREAVEEITITLDQEAVLAVITGEIGRDYSYSGPARILVNKD